MRYTEFRWKTGAKKATEERNVARGGGQPMTLKRGLASGVATLAAMAVLASGSVAQPSSLDITGTWNATSDVVIHIPLIIMQQAATTPCNPITGTMNKPGESTIFGFYCPADRTVTFTRTQKGSSDVRYYTGFVSTSGNEMAGSYTTIPSSPPPSGSDYPYQVWWAKKQLTAGRQ
jgi:hypothetical protein